MPNIRTQEVWCHVCSRYIQFDLNFDIDGNYTIPCPNCGHEHYRIVRNGRITGYRWQSSMQWTIINYANISYCSMDSASYGNYFFDSSGTSTTAAF